MNIKITADSTCDLSEELLRQWNISLMPMHILMGDDTYLDGVTIHPADVFAHVDAGGQTPKSAAANPVEYIDFFEPFAKEYDAVIHISVSAKLPPATRTPALPHRNMTMCRSSTARISAPVRVILSFVPPSGLRTA